MNDPLDQEEAHASVVEVAADWVDDLDGLTPEREAELQAWLRASPEHAAAFARMRKMMQDTALLEASVAARTIDTAQIIRQPHLARRTTQNRRAGNAAVGRRRVIAVGSAIAAAVAAAVAVTTWKTPPVASAQRQTYATAIGMRSDVVLNDQTIAHLGPDTRIAVLFTADRRDIRLDRGAATFEVAHNPSRPLTVEAGGVNATDIGTVFDVDRTEDATQVRVFQGAVSIRTSGGDWLLRKGDLATWRPSSGAEISRFDASSGQAGRTDWMEADSMPLRYAIARLNRYSAVPIVLDDPAKGNAPLTGRFDLRQTNATLHMIASLFGLRLVQNRSGLHLEDMPQN